MDISYYKQLLNIFPDKPHLKILKENFDVPETWPLFFKGVTDISKDALKFEITDLEKDFVCEITNQEFIEKVSALESGQIVFFYGSGVIRDKSENILKIRVEALYTLKEINDNGGKPPVKSGNIRKSRANVNSELTQSPVEKNKQTSRWSTLAERWHAQRKNN